MKSKTAMIVLLILLLTGINVITAQENPITITGVIDNDNPYVEIPMTVEGENFADIDPVYQIIMETVAIGE
jgi:hypothetical protein